MDSFAAAQKAPRPFKVIRWAFYAFVFSLLYEDISLGPVEPTLVCAGLFLLSTLLQPRLCYRLPHPAILCFGVYLAIAGSTGALYGGEHMPQVLQRLLVLTQLLLLCWTGYNLMRCEGVALGALRTFVAACVSLCLLQMIGAAGTVRDAVREADRFTAFGFHPNTIARILGMGLLILFSLSQAERKQRSAWLLWIAFALLAQSMVRTGSRGGLVAFAAGFLVLAFQGTGKQRARSLALVMAGVVVVAALSLMAENTRSRFEETLETGSLTRRELIYPEAWGMFVERPWLGWGLSSNTWELGDRLNHPWEPAKDTHNMVLYVLTATGLAGAVPFLLGVGLWVRAAWLARRGAAGILPLALTVFVLVANLSATGLEQKLMWFVLAFTLAAAEAAAVERRVVWARWIPEPAWGWR